MASAMSRKVWICNALLKVNEFGIWIAFYILHNKPTIIHFDFSQTIYVVWAYREFSNLVWSNDDCFRSPSLARSLYRLLYFEYLKINKWSSTMCFKLRGHWNFQHFSKRNSTFRTTCSSHTHTQQANYMIMKKKRIILQSNLSICRDRGERKVAISFFVELSDSILFWMDFTAIMWPLNWPALFWLFIMQHFNWLSKLFTLYQDGVISGNSPSATDDYKREYCSEREWE